MSEYIDKIANCDSIHREYYGDDKNNKPNKHCYWAETEYVIGWHETDYSFRKRVVAKFNSKNKIKRWKWIRSIHEFCRDCCTLMHGGK